MQRQDKKNCIFPKGIKFCSHSIAIFASRLAIENSLNFETEISSQCDNLIATIKTRKQQLLTFARKEKDYKLRILREQVMACTAKLQQTTGLIQFCIEALKDNDNMSYLQIGSSLINRVSNVEMTWHKDMNTSPWVSPEFDLTLDCQPVLMAIEQLNFSQMKLTKNVI
ncbi:unnamed protein product [Medioppia subpectinata]|uniref:COS domain-containing protein n=1 Tax=Medioppia subpectinata TaxID=1979941 RepID=A0A7R9QC80_9ACAR|nr:unnamed protein product [Medioppia subpectinata]CAG2118293.1 unnamed protein product [Medioppia subpectinata]